MKLPPPTSDLLKLSDETWEHITGKALEAYGIARHYSADPFPELVDGDPLRNAFTVVARASVAAALNKLAAGALSDRFTAAVLDVIRDELTQVAGELDLHVVELEDGANGIEAS